jgi:DNA-binding response OmpR family regulator
VPRVMIVDDDRTTVSLLRTLLELDGFDVVLAADGNTAFETAQTANPDVFLVDYHLADYKGIEFIKRLRGDEHFKKSPVIMTSGLNMEDEAKESGADVFLMKPFDPTELVKWLHRLLNRPAQ